MNYVITVTTIHFARTIFLRVSVPLSLEIKRCAYSVYKMITSYMSDYINVFVRK